MHKLWNLIPGRKPTLSSSNLPPEHSGLIWTTPRLRTLMRFTDRHTSVIKEFKKTSTATRESLNIRFISGTMAVHGRYNSWYISLPSLQIQQRKMTKFCVVWGTWNIRIICKIHFRILRCEPHSVSRLTERNKPPKLMTLEYREIRK